MPECESCDVVLTEETKSKIDGCYCVHCQDQSTGVLANYETVRKNTIMSIMKIMKNDYTQATRMVDRVLKKLPRWRQPASGEHNINVSEPNRCRQKPDIT